MQHHYLVYGLDSSGYKYKIKIIADRMEEALFHARISGFIPKRVDELEQAQTDYNGIISTDRINFGEQW